MMSITDIGSAFQVPLGACRLATEPGPCSPVEASTLPHHVSPKISSKSSDHSVTAGSEDLPFLDDTWRKAITATEQWACPRVFEREFRCEP
eukprot:1491486-Rhodomonas_salina.1